MQFVVFKLSNEYFAIETEVVQSISDTMAITKVPKSPEYVKGLINLRGSIKPLLNISMLLNMEVDKEQENIIILKMEEEEVGIAVDQVVEVIEIDSKSLQKMNNNSKEYIKGVIELKDNILTVIDINKILSV